MNQVVTEILLTEGVTHVTLNHFPSSLKEIAALLQAIADAGVNIDMISQTAPLGGAINISFSLPDEQLGAVLGVAGSYKSDHPELSSDISSGNLKIVFRGEQMRHTPGAAAGVFEKLDALGIDAIMITTAETEISVLCDAHSTHSVEDELTQTFGTAPVRS
ncbi:ACT domain-containing protein [Feifania hominis]|uniref:aspartate kinase n=1 Tax=Feifania hominis TaxID=2763660 RepID=A0A926DDZ0_9FIRM|nr:amino acid-binding protein [Feifania hominis]MBC8535559.1 amino acid-binding protein [Feifania hominis]